MQQQQKPNVLELITKAFNAWKNTIKQVKKQPTKWENICKSYAW